MAVVGSDFTDAKWELLDDVIDEVYGADLVVFHVNLEHPNTGRVINSCELETADLLAILPFKRQELNVHLNMVAGNLFVVALGMNLPQARTAWQSIDAVSLEHSGDGSVEYYDVVIARQIPDDAHWSEVIRLTQMKNFLLHFDGRAIGMSLGYRRSIYQAFFAVLLIGISPSVETASANTEVAARLIDMTSFFSMAQNAQFALNLALIFVHEHLLHPNLGRLMEMSRE